MIDIKDAAFATQLKVWSCSKAAIPEQHPAYGLRHVEDMLAAIVKGKVTGDKAHRWLGWAQAVVCIGGGATLGELKKINEGL